MVEFYHVYGVDNPADILSKHWSCTNIWKILQPLLFWMGDNTDFLHLELNRDGGQEKGKFPEIRRVFLFLVFPSLFLDYWNQIRIYDWIKITCIK